MKKHIRLTSLVLALMMALSCAASAAAPSFTYTRDGETHQLSIQVFDADGNLLPTTYATPRNVIVPAGGEVLVGKFPSDSPLDLYAGDWAYLTVNMATSAPLEIGYRLNGSGYTRLMYDSSYSSIHSASLNATRSGDYYFVIKNIANFSISISNVTVKI